MNEFLNDPAIVGEFITESREHLESLESQLLQLEKNPEDEELLNAIFRAFHTIKGSSSFLGLVQITELSHKLENVLDKLRKKQLKVTPEIIDLIFQGVDILKGFIEDIATGREDKIQRICSYKVEEVEEFAGKLEKVIQKPEIKKIGEKKDTFEKKDKEEEKQVFLTAAAQYLSTIKECIEGLEKNPSDFDLIDALFRAVHSLKSSSNYMKLSQIESLMEEEEKVLQRVREEKKTLTPGILNGLKLVYELLIKLVEDFEKGRKSQVKIEEAVEKIRGVFEEKDRDFQKSFTRETPPPKEFAQRTIRVPEFRLDQLMNLVGELVINRSTFQSILHKLENGLEISHLSQVKNEIKEAVQTMRRITNELQMTVTELHMLPIKNLFGRFPRLVRDISREKGKKIKLEISGEETQLDKMMIEKLQDPLVHLIRNAIDHGIETPEEREAKGKKPFGTIKLSASQEGESVVIEISDDGRGMDPDFIREVAVKKGILPEEKAKVLSRKECLELIFMPGFSTAKKVTDLSGRGVGMDVVKDAVKKLKGEIDIQTQIDKGTTFIIKLPLTLAIVNVLLVETGKQIFALPISSIKETVKLPQDRISKVFKEKVTLLREELLGIVDLKNLLQIPDGKGSKKEREESIPIVVISAGGKNLGLAVDALHKQEEIVIKPFEGIIADIPGITGATVMGDGKVILILDPGELIKMATEK